MGGKYDQYLLMIITGKFNKYNTRMHSSRMRTARTLTGGGGLIVKAKGKDDLDTIYSL